MGIVFDLTCKTPGFEPVFLSNCVLQGSVAVEITLNQKEKERKCDYLLGIPSDESSPQLVATLVVTQDNSLGIMNHSSLDVRVYFSFEEDYLSVGQDKLFHLTRSYSLESPGDLNVRELYASRISFYKDEKWLADLFLALKHGTLENVELLNYDVIRPLSVEPFGLYTVFLGEHKLVKGIKVAIKGPSSFALAQKRYDGVLERMEKAIDFLSGHPYIPPVFEIAERKSGHGKEVAYLIMKYIEGETLAHALGSNQMKTRAFSFGEVLQIVHKLSEVLEYVHRKGVVHRGVAPCNLMINRETGAFYLIGFGYCKILWDLYDIVPGTYHSIAPDSLRRRMPSKNLDFMPPEFFTSPDFFETTGDIYSWGAIFYSLLFSFCPYRYYILHDRKTRQNPFETYGYYFGNRILPPSVRQTLQFLQEDLKSKRFLPKNHDFFAQVVARLKEVPENLLTMAGEIVQKCLSLDPGSRYRNIPELQRDLGLLMAQTSMQSLGEYPRSSQGHDLWVVNDAYLDNQVKEAVRRVQASEENERVRQSRMQEGIIAALKKEIAEYQKKIGEMESRIDMERRKEWERLKEELEVFQAASLQSRDIWENTRIPGSHGIYYTIGEKLGEGGMGAVFKAFTSEHKEPVAVKVFVFPREHALENYLRFMLETYILLHLDHKNVLKALDCVQHQYLIYTVTEYLEGDTVEDLQLKRTMRTLLENDRPMDPRIRKQMEAVLEGKKRMTYLLADQVETLRPQSTPLELPVALEIVKGVARGLDYLHCLGIVHRDIKCSNIMVCQEKGECVPKIIDFGLAYHPQFKGRMTQHGFCIGTPFYISPERAQSDVGDIRSDIYSLGVVFYKMATGLYPFDVPTSDDMGEAEGQVFDPCMFNPEISPDVKSIIEKMVARRPEQRYQIPQELLYDLENLGTTR